MNDTDAPTITAPGTGRALASNAGKFTTDIISTRSTLNLFANGEDRDTEIAPAFLPFYTQISGTSMACPYIVGVISLMLDADPRLTPDEIKQILTETATRMPGTRLLPLSSRITASVPAPTTNVVQLNFAPHTALAMDHRSLKGPSLSIEKPKSLGSWLISTVSAIPFM